MSIDNLILTADDVDFEKYLEETEMKQRVIPANSYADEVVDYFHAPSFNHGDTLPFPALNEYVRFRPGEVSIWTGYNGHGKSLMLGQVLIGLVHQEKRVCVASMEMQPRTTLSRICRQFTGKRVPSRSEINGFLDTLSSHFYLYDHQGVVQWRKLLGVLRYCANEAGIEHFVIDSLLKCGIKEDDYNTQKEFVDHLCTIGRDTGMHIHLVCHSRKGADETRVPGKMDIRGSASISDQVDNVFSVWRNKNESRLPGEDGYLLVDKQRNGEWEGLIVLSYKNESQSYTHNLHR